jgi:outer membrane protein assembly factor BamE (lipoprotein component of BamABCDE complex)
MTASQEAPRTRVDGCLGCLGAAVVFLAALVALQFALLDGLEGVLLSLMAQEDTQYSPGYSDGGFRAVKVGMEAAEVERLLGKPLDQRIMPGGTYWYFARSPGSTHYRMRIIRFDANGRVREKWSGFYLD